MQINIIHLSERTDRWELLKKELDSQGISDFKIWPGIVDSVIPARGISKAHKQIVRYAKELELPEVLIAEDDLKFTANEAFDFFLRNKSPDFDIYLSSIYYGKIAKDNTVDDFSGLTFYIVKQKFYNKFLSIPEHDNLDRSLRKSGNFIVCNPFTVIQYNGFSDNLNKYCNYEGFLKGRKFFSADDH
jgi:hypothetical protein